MQIHEDLKRETPRPAQPKPKDRHTLFVVEYVDGRHDFLRMPARLAEFGAGPMVIRFAAEEQLHGRLQRGDIARLVGVR
jgi:hypothetical protein